MKQLEVTIMGQSYLLACNEGGEAALLEAVALVDKEMCAIRDAGKVKARERIAVLAALNLAFERAGAADSTPGPAKEKPLAADSERIAGLLQRIDSALGHEGRLL